MMKKPIFLCLFFGASLLASSYGEMTAKIVKELNYIFQNRGYKGGTTFKKAQWFEYRFTVLDEYSIEITEYRAEKKVYILDVRKGYSVALDEDNTCHPALTFSHEEEIIYLYVKERCGVFGGYNLYPRAKDAVVRLKGYMFELSHMGEKGD